MSANRIISNWAQRCLVMVTVLSALLLGAGYAAEAKVRQDGAGVTTTAPTSVPAYRKANHIGVLTVRGAIDRITLMSLERRIREAVQDGVDAIVLELDTPGGEMTATLDICDLLMDRQDTPVNTVAWINDRAFSAGTIIALACREMVVAPGADLGDAAPIQVGPMGLQQLPAAERAKLESPLLNQVRESARLHHYDESLVTAFISVQVELWLIQNTVTGEKIFINAPEYEQLFGEEPPRDLTPVGSPPANAPPVSPRRSTISEKVDEDQAARGEQASDFAVAAPPWQELPTKDTIDDWALIGPVIGNDTLLTLTAPRAVYFGLAREIIADDEELRAFFGASTLTRYDIAWSEQFVRFLIWWPVRLVLIVVFVIGLFIELAVPGMGVFGGAAAVALLLLIGAPALAGLAEWWDILLILLGLLLVLVELFVIPGFGVAGVSGAACLLVGMIGTFVTGDLSSSDAQGDIVKGVLTTLTGAFAAGIGIWICSRWFHTLPLFRRLMLTHELGSDSAAAHAAMSAGVFEAMAAPQRALEPGDLGTAQTTLRPSGEGMFGGRLVDVQSIGSYIDQGSRIRIVNVGRYVIEVELAGEEETSS